ncbi:Zn(II)2Cys6 transcription factor [Aspergillus aculeatinus CBS 121060]|uniref:Uncharacterized protein n=1 Tax=Aspergillus aculeatinus CBS 121060 TaxID=1448322 RepID=A0ACD1HPD9_9EURO|nr:hypothetical protein BO66DRAFT_8110 [Aspergillus aculeatinus CBS 121060]RAH75416.1 hypothetical protein BO66DRAFT_8110 [Aspergillus aculeatinus CBS 121060]
MPRQSPEPTLSLSPSTSQDLTFLPVNQPHSPDSLRARRGYQSCDNCRLRKKRCEPSSRSSICWRCQQESRACLTTHRRKRRKLRPPVGSAVSDAVVGGEDGEAVAATSQTSTTGAGALPHASHHISARDDLEPADMQHRASTPQGVAVVSGNPDWGSSTKERILSTSILDACDALDLIAVSGTKDGLEKDGMGMGDLHQSRGTASQQQQQPSSAPTVSACPTSAWDRFFLVKRGIIQPHEAIEYLGFYFAQLWPLFPVIPRCYASADRYAGLASEEPVLTISLVTIASRYHALRGFNGQARSERIHWRAWPWVQRLIQSSIWGSSAMRSLGAITAMLLLIEWHPRVINSPEDLIGDCGEVELFEPPLHEGPEAQMEGPAGPTDVYRRSDSSNVPERLNIIAPAYRSSKMSRMLLSVAISIGQELGCLREGLVVVVDSTPSRGASQPPPARLEWIRNLRTFIRLTDEALTLRLRTEPQLSSSSSAEIDCASAPLVADGCAGPTIELASHMCQARDLLRSWRKSQQGTGPSVSISAWDNFTRGLNTWESKHLVGGRGKQGSAPHRPIPKGQGQVLTHQQPYLSLGDVCLYIEYYYIRLCGLSPASQTFESSPRIHPRNAYLRSLSQFADEATKASVDMLELIVHFSSSSRPFRYAPVRYWLYIFCAALYLLKVTLRNNEHVDRPNTSVSLITRVVETMKHNAPDDVHMSQRYAALLDIIVHAALRTSQDRDRDRDRTAHPSPLPAAHNTLLEGTELGLGEEWIFDASFWNTLPDMVGLDGVPDLIMPPFE